MNDFETFILRFRDLSVSDTIKVHQTIISNNNVKPFAWWGWWSKPQEKVALDVFSKIKENCSETNPLTIYLFDSGKIELYQAKCIDIKFSNGDYIDSPDKENTPDYYSQNRYMLWFKLTEITEKFENVNDILRQFSYVEIDEHFVEQQSPFKMFDQKIVYNAHELFEQQRTIWYIRKAIETDCDREICSYNPPLESYENRFSINNGNCILWLSDLHFSESHHAFKKELGSDNQLENLLSLKIATISASRPTRIIASGDFTFSSLTSEFESASCFIKKLQSIYGIDNSSLTICPGNHDFSYSNDAYKDNDKVIVNFLEAKKNYLSFYENVKESQARPFMNSIQRFIAQDGKLIEIISLNTCILQQDEEHFKGMGFAGNDQLRDLEKELKKTSSLNAFRILVMHHNLLPVAYSEKPHINPMYSMLLDSEAISQFCINSNIRLILHGHAHKNYYTKVTRQNTDDKEICYYIIGLGSSGAIQTDLSEGCNNEFALIYLNSNQLEIKIYNIMPNGNNGDILPIKTFSIKYEEEL